MTTMMMMVAVIQFKRCWVPKGIYFWHQRKRGEHLPIRERNEKHGEESAPTKNEPVVAGEFPLHLLIITLLGTKSPWKLQFSTSQ